MGNRLRIYLFVSLSRGCLSVCLHALLAVFVLSLWTLKHAGNLQKPLLPCMTTKQSAAGGLKVKQWLQSSRQRAAEKRPRPKLVGSSLRGAGGDHVHNFFPAAGGGPQTAGHITNLQSARFFQSAEAVF